MPVRNNRTIATTRLGKFATSGRRSVVYRDTRGRTWDALVLSGSASISGLRLRITSDNGRIIDNVAAAPFAKATNVYFSRTD